MIKLVARRLALLVPILLGVAAIVFAAVRLIPGDPATVILGERATEQAKIALRHELGLDRPILVQFGSYLWDLAHGDLGRSLTTGNPVGYEVVHRFPATFELAVAAMILALAIGVPLGLYAAVRRNSWVDYLATGSSLLGVSMPIFWLGLVLMLVFSAQLRLAPLSGRLDLALDVDAITGLYLVDTLLRGDLAAFRSTLAHLALPALTLATVPLAIISRMTRAAMLEVLGQDYVRTARAKGLDEGKVYWRHALRNAAIPIVTVGGLQFGTLLSGAVITETIFSWPGIGSLAVGAVFSRDFPLLQGCVLLFALTFVLVNLATDLAYQALDPRLRA
ncbi:MAG: ABC transporter permease [Candidatus Sericytochromatia bacterium]|uniref:ABC transporter permease n=1 Tax=Candidatus Tanganyikabacteria bacterium TaxID=2961651 RepID=A0A938BKG3_9BACT|nr:ABC transporter permease [Candidatus Tanganyikabacteria bacterium]